MGQPKDEQLLKWQERRRTHKELETKQRQEQERKAESLLEVVNDSARHVRNFYITFLLLALYVSVIVWSTTDEMLLRISPVTLPLLNIELPIKGFYTFAPYLLLLAHFNLLLQLYLLSVKLHRLNDTVGALPDRPLRAHFESRLFPFPFAQMLSTNHHGWLGQLLLTIMVWILILVLPPVVLVLLQLGFLPFHDAAILFWQRIAIVMDLVLLWGLWPMIRGTDNRLRSWYGQASETVWLIRRIFGRPARVGKPFVEACILSVMTVALVVFSWGLATLPGETKQRFWAHWLPSSAWNEKKDELKWASRLFDGSISPFHRNLRIREKLLIANEIGPPDEQKLRNAEDPREIEAVLAKIRGLNLKGRDLRGADFSNALLPKVDLRGAHLQGAHLHWVHLQGADLSGAHLQGADLSGAHLQGADLREANLALVDLRSVHIGKFTLEIKKMEAELAKDILDDKTRHRVLNRIKGNLYKDTNVTGALGDNLLVDSDPESDSRKLIARADGLKSAATMEEYLQRLTPVLAKLACGNRYTAKLMVMSRIPSSSNTDTKTCQIASSLLEARTTGEMQCPGLSKLDTGLVKRLEAAARSCGDR